LELSGHLKDEINGYVVPVMPSVWLTEGGCIEEELSHHSNIKVGFTHQQNHKNISAFLGLLATFPLADKS
jgi:hypothetical protein